MVDVCRLTFEQLIKQKRFMSHLRRCFKFHLNVEWKRRWKCHFLLRPVLWSGYSNTSRLCLVQSFLTMQGITYADPFLHIIELREKWSCILVNHNLRTRLYFAFYTSYDIQLRKKEWVGKLSLFPHCSKHNSSRAWGIQLSFVSLCSHEFTHNYIIVVCVSAGKINC